MKRSMVLSGIVALFAASVAACAPPASGAPAASAAHPTVVELFQSQGCSSCPPANANLNAVADRPDILALSFAVTYWDNLGWKDTFASQQFTDRQWDYAHGLGHDNVFTPQVVINGARDTVGAKSSEFNAAVASGGAPQGPAITATAQSISIGAGEGKADVWLVRYDPRIQQVPIKAGENTGRTLPHKNIVRELKRLGEWRGTEVSYALPPAADPALRTAILVQKPKGGAIIAAAKL
jgi:hypothetical protein